MNERYYLLKVELLGIKPAIWRRFVVPADISLDRLHDVIQIVMGWTNNHLHEFLIGKKRYTEFQDCEDPGLECGKYRLVDLIKQKGRTFRYVYDFGDYWQHDVVIEDSRYFDPDLVAIPICLEGERACPPEDVGGTGGYEDFCRSIKDPTDFDHDRLIEWSGGNYDSERFDVGAVNLDLFRYRNWSRDRYLDWGNEY